MLRPAAHYRRYLAGVALIFLVDTLWTASNYLANTILTHGYNQPFAVTYASTASFILYLLPFVIMHASSGGRTGARAHGEPQRWWEALGFRLPPSRGFRTYVTHELIYALTISDVEELSAQGEQIPESIPRLSEEALQNHQARTGPATSRRRPETNDQAASHADEHLDDEADEDRGLVEGEPDPIVAHAAKLPPLGVRETAKLAIPFATVWFAANWSFVAAVGLTSVASGTTLGSTSGFFTLLLGTVCGTDRITAGKLFSVVLSTLGVFLVTRTDAAQQQPPAAGAHPVLGDALAIFSAVCYAVYATLLRLRIGSEERISMPLFLGFVGAFSVVAFWPLGVFLDLLGVERFSAPIDKLTWTGVLINMLITVVSDFAYLLAMLKSSPLFTTIGLSLTIPMSVLVDWWQHAHSTRLQSALGSVLVLVSFAGIAWEENHEL